MTEAQSIAAPNIREVHFENTNEANVYMPSWVADLLAQPAHKVRNAACNIGFGLAVGAANAGFLMLAAYVAFCWFWKQVAP